MSQLQNRYLSIQCLDGTRGLLTRGVSHKSESSGSSSFTVYDDPSYNGGKEKKGKQGKQRLLKKNTDLA